MQGAWATRATQAQRCPQAGVQSLTARSENLVGQLRLECGVTGLDVYVFDLRVRLIGQG